MKKVKMILVAMTAVMMMSGFALASTITPVPSFEQLDANRDNLISKSEALTIDAVIALFEMADVNEDLVLTEGEFAYVTRWTSNSQS